MAASNMDEADWQGNVMADLGMRLWPDDVGLRGTIPAVPEMAVPGTDLLRISALSAIADLQIGMLAVRAFAPRVPVTLTLDVTLFRPVLTQGLVHATGRVIKSGRSVMVAGLDLTDDAGNPVGVSNGLFMTAPNPDLQMPPMDWATLVTMLPTGALTMPYAQRSGCQRISPGVASQPVHPGVMNASGGLNGGLLPLAVEEAMLSLRPGGLLTALSLRYLRPIRQGPAVARAVLHGDVCTVEMYDAATDALAVLATGHFAARPAGTASGTEGAAAAGTAAGPGAAVMAGHGAAAGCGAPGVAAAPLDFPPPQTRN